MKKSKSITNIIKIVSIIIAFCITLSGFNTGENLNDLSIVEGMGIDSKNGLTEVTLQTLNLVKEGNGSEALSGSLTINTSGCGENITSALKNLTKNLSKKLFFGQNRIIVFGKEFAENELIKNLDYLLRSDYSRADMLLCIADKSAKEIMNSKENDAIVPPQSIASLLISGEKRGFSAKVNTKTLLNLYKDKTSDIYLPVVKIDQNSAAVLGIAIYSNNKMVKILENEDVEGFLFLLNKAKSGGVLVESTTLGKTTVEFIKAKTKTKARFINGQVIFDANINLNLKINESEKGINKKIDKEVLKEIQILTQEKVKDICTHSFNTCVKLKSDCLRIGESLAMNNPKAYKKVVKNWDEYLKNAKLNISVKCKIKKANENS